MPYKPSASSHPEGSFKRWLGPTQTTSTVDSHNARMIQRLPAAQGTDKAPRWRWGWGWGKGEFEKQVPCWLKVQNSAQQLSPAAALRTKMPGWAQPAMWESRLGPGPPPARHRLAARGHPLELAQPWSRSPDPGDCFLSSGTSTSGWFRPVLPSLPGSPPPGSVRGSPASPVWRPCTSSTHRGLSSGGHQDTPARDPPLLHQGRSPSVHEGPGSYTRSRLSSPRPGPGALGQRLPRAGPPAPATRGPKAGLWLSQLRLPPLRITIQRNTDRTQRRAESAVPRHCYFFPGYPQV